MGLCETSEPSGIPSILSLGSGAWKTRLYQGVAEGGVYHCNREAGVRTEPVAPVPGGEEKRERRWR